VVTCIPAVLVSCVYHSNEPPGFHVETDASGIGGIYISLPLMYLVVIERSPSIGRICLRFCFVWQNGRLIMFCDNEAVVQQGSIRGPFITPLLLLATLFNIDICGYLDTHSC
jgi:hypothetical protein